MADTNQDRVPPKKISHELKDIAADLEAKAGLLQLAGHVEEAAGLRKWARELQQKLEIR